MIKTFSAAVIATLLIFSGCNLDSEKNIETSPSESLPPIVTPSTKAENETESSALSPAKIEELKKEYWWHYEKDNYLFLGEINYNFVENNHLYEGLECRLLSTDGDFDESIIIVDKAYADSLYYYFEEIPQKVECEIDTDEKTVLITASKHNFFLDFNNQTVAYEEKYRLQDLDTHRQFISPDNSFVIYSTEVMGAGESIWGDLVVLDKSTNDIWYLNSYSAYINPIFVDNNKVLLCYPDSIYLYDLAARATLTEVPQFEFGVSAQRENSPFYWIIGAAYDDVSKQILIAYRENSYTIGEQDLERTHEVYIDIFNDVGQKIDTIYTGILTQIAIHSRYSPVYLKLVADRNVEISAYLQKQYSEKPVMTILGVVEY